MSEQDSQQWDAFDRLLERMPRIADAVNAFKSEATQSAALELLAHTTPLPDDRARAGAPTGGPPELTVVASPAEQMGEEDSQQASTGNAEAGKVNGRRRRTRKPSVKATGMRAADVNFRPEDGPSLRDFAAEKAPANNHERNLLAVYFMEHTLGLTAIEAGHVVAAYRECDWRCPGDPEASLRVTASRKGWLNTSVGKAIRTTISGQNRVRHDMPAKREAKSA